MQPHTFEAASSGTLPMLRRAVTNQPVYSGYALGTTVLQ